jgi:predicted Zn-dependent protease
MYNSGRNQLTSDLLDALAKGNVREKNAAQYGQALQAMEASKYDEARKALQPLLAPIRTTRGISIDGYRSGAEENGRCD